MRYYPGSSMTIFFVDPQPAACVPLRMHKVTDVAALVVRHGPIEINRLHHALFLINSKSYLETGALMFPDVALAMPSGPVFPGLDIAVGTARWRRRHEARRGTRGRRGSQRFPRIESLIPKRGV
jgi:hypothetical protein